jgi:hypothetical protein
VIKYLYNLIDSLRLRSYKKVLPFGNHINTQALDTREMIITVVVIQPPPSGFHLAVSKVELSNVAWRPNTTIRLSV